MKKIATYLGFILNNDKACFWIIIVFHLIIALFYKEVVGLDIQANPRWRPWDWWWQTIPVDLIINDLWRSIWYLHFQPPIFNLYGAFFFNAFPNDPMKWMQLGNILLGSLISGMIYIILVKMTKRRLISFLLGIVFALDAGLFLFEAYILYDILTLFWVIVGVTFLAVYVNSEKTYYIYLYIFSICILVLTRSVYHILIVPIGILLAIISSPRNYWKTLLVGLLISLIPLGWYVKNYSMFGFFGASSWQGFGLWKVVSQNYPLDELELLKDKGIINPMVADVEILRPASRYIPYGFDLQSKIPLLSRDDQRNINMIQVAREYQKSAIQLIKLDPYRYLRSVYNSYLIFNIPSARFKHHILNIEKMPQHSWLVADVIQGHTLERFVHYPFGSFYFFLIPLCLLIYGLDSIYEILLKKKNPIAFVRGNLVETWIIFLIVYTTIVSISFEVGENNREKFYIESLVIIFLAILLSQYLPILIRNLTKTDFKLSVFTAR